MTPTFATLLRGHRVRAGLSQKRLAACAERDHSIVCRYELGTRMPSRPMVTSLADALCLADQERTDFFTAAGMLEGDGAQHPRYIGDARATIVAAAMRVVDEQRSYTGLSREALNVLASAVDSARDGEAWRAVGGRVAA